MKYSLQKTTNKLVQMVQLGTDISSCFIDAVQTAGEFRAYGWINPPPQMAEHCASVVNDVIDLIQKNQIDTQVNQSSENKEKEIETPNQATGDGCVSHKDYGDICPLRYLYVKQNIGTQWGPLESLGCIDFGGNPFGYYSITRIIGGWTYYNINDPNRIEIAGWWNGIMPDGSDGAVVGPLVVDYILNIPFCGVP